MIRSELRKNPFGSCMEDGLEWKEAGDSTLKMEAIAEVQLRDDEDLN